jgi:hypothetical protein
MLTDIQANIGFFGGLIVAFLVCLFALLVTPRFRQPLSKWLDVAAAVVVVLAVATSIIVAIKYINQPVYAYPQVDPNKTVEITAYSVNSDYDFLGVQPFSVYCDRAVAQDVADGLNKANTAMGKQTTAVHSEVMVRNLTIWKKSGRATFEEHEMTGYPCRTSLADRRWDEPPQYE